MPTYISLIHFTPGGAETIKDGPRRVDAATQAFGAAGAELKAFYPMTGQYDAVVISEVPNDETVAKLARATAALGNVRTENLRVFVENEYRKMIASLPSGPDAVHSSLLPQPDRRPMARHEKPIVEAHLAT